MTTPKIRTLPQVALTLIAIAVLVMLPRFLGIGRGIGSTVAASALLLAAVLLLSFGTAFRRAKRSPRRAPATGDAKGGAPPNRNDAQAVWENEGGAVRPGPSPRT